MALTVNLWAFSKRQNSTKIPAPAAIAWSGSCTLKSESGILNPVLELSLPISTNPAGWNYAQIPAYGRYYFITDWQWSAGLWLVSLAVDPLASWRIAIGSSTKYVLRCAAEKTSALIDTLYPALARKITTKTSADLGFAVHNLENGVFVLGIVSGGGTFGSVTYYGIDALNLSALADIMFPQKTITDWSSPFTGMTDALYRSIYDPFQYLSSCRWFPYYDASAFGTTENLQFGNYLTGVSGRPLQGIEYFPEINWNMALPTNWINLPARERSAPFASVLLNLLPYGNIELPVDRIVDSSLSCYLKIDYVSGRTLLQVYSGTSRTNGTLIYEASANIASEIQLTAAYARVQDALRATGAAAGLLIAGGTAGLALPGAVASAAEAAAPHTAGTIGNNEGFSFIDGLATLTVQQSVFPTESPDEYGYPLYSIRTLGNLGADQNTSGYIKCGEGEVEIPGFPEEMSAISEYLTGGFFFE